MARQVFGFKDWTLDVLASRLSEVMGTKFEKRNNILWGSYIRFQEGDPDIIMVRNSVPTDPYDHEEVAEPDFLDYPLKLYLSAWNISAFLTQQILSIGRATMLKDSP